MEVPGEAREPWTAFAEGRINRSHPLPFSIFSFFLHFSPVSHVYLILPPSPFFYLLPFCSTIPFSFVFTFSPPWASFSSPCPPTLFHLLAPCHELQGVQTHPPQAHSSCLLAGCGTSVAGPWCWESDESSGKMNIRFSPGTGR